MMEYVSKKDLAPYKKLFNEAIKYVHTNLPSLSFYYRLVGSAKRNLVLNHHNKGFDLDYQIIFNQSIQSRKSDELIAIKNSFRKTLDDFFVNKGYDYAENSTSAITIKNKQESKIINSYDVVLISPEDDGLYIFKYIDTEKTLMNLSKIHNSFRFQKQYNQIKGNSMWSSLRDIYKYKKNNNI